LTAEVRRNDLHREIFRAGNMDDKKDTGLGRVQWTGSKILKTKGNNLIHPESLIENDTGEKFFIYCKMYFWDFVTDKSIIIGNE